VADDAGEDDGAWLSVLLALLEEQPDSHRAAMTNKTTDGADITRVNIVTSWGGSSGEKFADNYYMRGHH
jgi:hypothetical protein